MNFLRVLYRGKQTLELSIFYVKKSGKVHHEGEQGLLECTIMPDGIIFNFSLDAMELITRREKQVT